MIPLEGIEGGPFRIVLADPPWKFRNTGSRGAAERHYRTMSVQEICALPVPAVVKRHSVLLLWAVWSMLPEALYVMSHWGFKYRTGFPWVKVSSGPQLNLSGNIEFAPKYGAGWWVRGCSELLLIGVKGSVKPKGGNFCGILSDNAVHSRKPKSVYEYAEAFDGPWLELFARGGARQNWKIWGHEAEVEDGSLRDRS